MNSESSKPTNVGSNAVLGAGANMLALDPYNLDFVVMPLVRMLAERQLSWSNREQIAHAIIATTAHHKSLTDEIHAQGSACGLSQQAKPSTS